MIRLARSASLLVAFYLLTSAATASAECAWVLWGESSGWRAWFGSRRSPVRAFESRRDCQDIETAFNLIRTNAVDTKTRENAKALGYDANAMDYRCLPDTVDPRGPKERTR